MLLIMTAASIATPVLTASASEVRAFIRIERGVRINAEEWARSSSEAARRERIVKDEQGQLQLQRVVDYE